MYGMTGIWLFGREFSDHTAKDLLALPTSRTSVVLAKFLVGALWAATLTVQMVLLGLVIGTALGLPGEVTAGDVLRLPVIAVMTWLLTTPLSLAASLGRGYLAAVGVLFVIVFCAQIITALGFGAYFPWSVPGLYAGLGGTTYDPPGVVGYLLVVLVGAAGVAATAIWWERADHTR
ncbi:ABC transporter permease [Sphaerisporangium flaviroseum]